MKYDFDRVVNRRNTNSVKWDSSKEDVIPMWIADMDFPVAEPIVEALQKRVEHGIFGYASIPDAYYEAEAYWWEKRHGFRIKKAWIDVTTGIIPALSAIVQAFTQQGDRVLIQSPVYNYFGTSIINNGCEIVENDLKNIQGHYEVDFEDFEKKASDDRVKLFILCNPHNPVGRAFTREELIRMGEICLRNNVLVVVDEAHRDLVYSGFKHIPFASLNEDFLMNSVTCTAPSKTFNIAGLKTANIITANEKLKQKVNKSININEAIEPNVFGIEALTAAYTYGEKWLDALLSYLEDNMNFLKAFVAERLPELKLTSPEATYLAWLDCTGTGKSSKALCSLIYEQGAVRLNVGDTYGKNGTGFLRMNLACPRSVLEEGLLRIEKVMVEVREK